MCYVAAPLAQNDWVFALKNRIKRNRRLATALFYLTDHAYLNNAPRRRFVASFPQRARLMNLGAGFRPSPPGFLAMDYEPMDGVDVVAEMGGLPFKSGSLEIGRASWRE